MGLKQLSLKYFFFFKKRGICTKIFFIDLCRQFWRTRLNFFEETRNDENQQASSKDLLEVLIEPITSSKAKKIRKTFNWFIQDILATTNLKDSTKDRWTWGKAWQQRGRADNGSFLVVCRLLRRQLPYSISAASGFFILQWLLTFQGFLVGSLKLIILPDFLILQWVKVESTILLFQGN
jgi:hypothetical protein